MQANEGNLRRKRKRHVALVTPRGTMRVSHLGQRRPSTPALIFLDHLQHGGLCDSELSASHVGRAAGGGLAGVSEHEIRRREARSLVGGGGRGAEIPRLPLGVVGEAHISHVNAEQRLVRRRAPVRRRRRLVPFEHRWRDSVAFHFLIWRRLDCRIV